MKRPNKQKCIELIVKHIDNGLTYSESLDYFVQKWATPRSTFVNYWNEAQEIHSERRERIENEKMIATIEAEKEAVNRNILSKLDALEILTEIATNQIISDKGNTNDADRINAIKTINQMQGYNAPKESKLEIGVNDTLEEAKRIADELKDEA